jgi:hypothetical protein
MPPPAQTPMGAVSLGSETVAYGLSNYFTDPNALHYWLAANPHSNAVISAGGVLSVTGAHVGGTYVVVVGASNDLGLAVTSALTVIESGAAYQAAAGGYTSVDGGYTGADVTVAVGGATYVGSWLQVRLPAPIVPSSYFVKSTVTGAVGFNTVADWSLLGSVDGAAWTLLSVVIGNAAITATPSIVTTLAYTHFRMVIRRQQAPYPRGAPYYGPIVNQLKLYGATQSLGAVTLSNDSLSCALSNLFVDPQGTAMSYWLAYDPAYSNATVSIDGELRVDGFYRGVAYDVVVGASNAYGLVTTDALVVTESPALPPSVASLGTTTVSDDSIRTFRMSEYFIDPQSSPLSYWMVGEKDPLSTTTLAADGTLTVAGEWRGPDVYTYAVLVAASNVYGMSNAGTLTVTVAYTDVVGGDTLAPTSGAISLGEIGTGCGIVGSVSMSALYSGGSNVAVTAIGVPTGGSIPLKTFRGANAAYTPSTASFNLDMPYPSNAPAASNFLAAFRSDLASNLNLPVRLVNVYGIATPDGNGTVVSAAISLPLNQDLTTAAVNKLSAATTRNDPASILSASTMTALASASMATSFVAPLLPAARPAALPLGAAGLSNNVVTLDLGNYFSSSPVGAALSYAVPLSGNPYSNAAVLNKKLLIQGASRGVSYNVNVIAVTRNGLSNASTLAVTEYGPSGAATLAAALPPIVASPMGSVTLSASSPVASFVLAKTFSDPAASPLTYSLSNQAFSAATLSPAGLLTVVHAFRNVTYSVTAVATNAFGKSVAATLTVTELATVVPMALNAAGVIALTTNTCNVSLDPMFSDSTGLGLTYALTSNPRGSAAIARGVLSVVGKARVSLGPYVVGVTATNAYNASASMALTVTESGTRSPAALIALGSASLGKNRYTVDLRLTFSDPVGLGLSFSLTNNPNGSASISDSGVLTVLGANRNASYGVTVTASNSAGIAQQTLFVSESSAATIIVPPTVLAALGPISISPGAASVTFALGSYFAGTNLTYELTGNPRSNAAISAGALTVTGAFRASTYGVGVSASNTAGVASGTLTVTEPSPAIVATSMGSVTLGSTVGATASRSGAFTDPTGAGLLYRATTNPYANATVSNTGVLTVTCALRGSTYTVVVTATNTTYGTSATSTLTVTEPSAPAAPTLTAAVSSLSGTSAVAAVSFPLAGYQTTAGVGVLTWSLQPVGGTAGVSLAASSGVLSVAKGTTLSGQTLFITVTNAFGVSATLSLSVTVTCPRVGSASAPAVRTLGRGSLSYALADVFNDAFGAGLSYAMLANPKDNATIAAGGILTIACAYRGLTYSVQVLATDVNGFTATQAFAVTEAAPLPPPTVVPMGSVTLFNTAAAYYGMSNVFFDPEGAALYYWLSANPKSNAALTPGGVLGVTGNYRNAAYDVVASASNVSGTSSTAALAVTEVAASAPTTTTWDSVTLSNATVAYYGMSNIFTDPQGATLYYWFSANPKSNAALTTGGVLGVTGALRNASYDVVVSASNVYGKSNAGTLVVTETGAPPLFAFTSYTFNTAGALKQNGPTLAQLQVGYSGTTWFSGFFVLYNAMAGYQQWTIPVSTTYTITAYGGTGAAVPMRVGVGGGGGCISARFALLAGDCIIMVVGQVAVGYDASYAGGGGGTFIVNRSATGVLVPLVVAGGGGGAFKNINGLPATTMSPYGTVPKNGTGSGCGLGYNSFNNLTGTISPLTGYTGGFGGGGCGTPYLTPGAGGGGGFIGGASGPGGAGTNYIATGYSGYVSTVSTSSGNYGNGSVTISI